MRHKLLSHLAITAAVCLAYPGIAAACSCAGHSTSFDMSADDVNVYATATMSLSADCEGWVFANITAPDNSTAGNSAYVEGEASTTGTKPIGNPPLEGDYSGLGNYNWDNIPGGGVGSGSYASLNSHVGIAIPSTAWDFTFFDSGAPDHECNYQKASYCPVNSCGTATIAGPMRTDYVPPICDRHIYANWIAATYGGARHCFPYGVGGAAALQTHSTLVTEEPMR